MRSGEQIVGGGRQLLALACQGKDYTGTVTFARATRGHRGCCAGARWLACKSAGFRLVSAGKQDENDGG